MSADRQKIHLAEMEMGLMEMCIKVSQDRCFVLTDQFILTARICDVIPQNCLLLNDYTLSLRLSCSVLFRFI